MSDENVANNWRLEETGETQDRWKLETTEQGLVNQWQLQDEPRTEAAWQPVDYTRERQGPGNWVLPSLVVLSLIAVVGYIAWIGLTRLNLLTPTSPTDLSTPAAVADANTPDPGALAANPVITQTTEPTLAPTKAPTAIIVPTPAPTPTVARMEQAFVSVSDPAGVNARSEPNATSAVVKLLEPGQRVLVVTQAQDWIQVALAKDSLAWVKAEFVDRTTQVVSLDEANQRRVALGLAPLASAPSSVAVTDTTPSTLTAGITSTTGITNIAGVTNPTTAPIVSAPLTATINISTGLNARTVPTTTGTPIKLLNNGARYKVTGRSADDQWLQITLEDGTSAWVFAEYVNVNGNTNTLPVPSSTATLTTTIPVSGTTGTAGGAATLTVTSLSGANARPTPDRAAVSLTLFPFEAALPVVGRSADNQWLQVRLNDGTLGWMLTSAVKLSVDIATVPIVNP